jgi:hypothetical protein
MRLRIICLGYIVRCPLGGMAWHHLQYILGLNRLGHDVFFVEDSGDSTWACYDPDRQTNGPDPGYGLRFIAELFDRFGLGDRWIYHDALGGRRYGSYAARLMEICQSADLLLNLSGSNLLRPWGEAVAERVYVDTDPGFTQVQHLTDAKRRQRAEQHTTFLTFGENICRPSCSVPDDGLPWQPTRQPVVLDCWEVAPPSPNGPLTTIMQWDNTLQSVPREYAGRRYGRKAVSFMPFLHLPRQSGHVFELALSGADVLTREQLRSAGWSLRDPLEPTLNIWTYQNYIRGSKAEFSVAKEGYVTSGSGWFSERSSAYLASGRPVIVQDTGFSTWLGTGEGVLAFRSPEEAFEMLEELNANYALHCRRARELAVEFFDSRAVLQRLLDAAA